MSFKVGVDFHVLDGKYQGSRTHLVELFSRVVVMAPEIDFYFFLDKVEALAGCSPAFASPNVHPVRMPHAGPVKRLCWQLPKMQREYSLDLMHTQYVGPLPSFSPCVVTIHDILFETHPQYFTRFFVLRSRAMMRLAAMRSRRVFTVSEFTKAELIKRYSVSPDRLTVIHNGVDRRKFFPGPDGAEHLARWGLSSNGYILSVGRLEPRKNHCALLDAYASIGPSAPPLVIVGQRDFSFGAIFQTLERLELTQRVRILEDVDDDDLPVIYRHAKLFVYPSWAEGFGIPPLEAMASGIPVISSNTTAIPEVTGDAALLIDPGSPVQIAEGMTRVMGDDPLRRDMVAKGLARALEFSWENAAKKTLEGYADALKPR